MSRFMTCQVTCMRSAQVYSTVAEQGQKTGEDTTVGYRLAPCKKIKGQLVYTNAGGMRAKVKAVMSLRSGRVFVLPEEGTSRPCIPAKDFPGNPGGNGELQVWGFGCLPVRNGRLSDATAPLLDSIADEISRLRVHSRCVCH